MVALDALDALSVPPLANNFNRICSIPPVVEMKYWIYIDPMHAQSPDAWALISLDANSVQTVRHGRSVRTGYDSIRIVGNTCLGKILYVHRRARLFVYALSFI
jgi:hypothetical protein